MKIVRSLFESPRPKVADTETSSETSTPTEPVAQTERAWAKAPVDGAEEKRTQAPQANEGPGVKPRLPTGPATGMLALRSMQQSSGGELGTDVKLSALTRGQRFSFGTEAIERVVGQPLTRAGLTDLYANCLPGTTPAITQASAQGDTFKYMVSWFDNNGQEVARAGRNIKKLDDGSLEMHVHTVWTSPDVRGRGLSAKAMLAEIEMLRAVSDDERTCLSLRAGGMPDVNAKDGAKTERVGSYAWANFGYDFADANGKEPFFFYGDRIAAEADDSSLRGLSALQLMQRNFTTFVDEHMEEGNLPQGPDVRAALLDAAKTWKKPWDVSSFHVDGMTIEHDVGGKTVPFHLGKAFLISDHSVNWDAVVFVNADDTGRKVQEAYCDRALSKCDAAEDKTRAAWMAGLSSDDRAERASAFEQIGRFGDGSWREALSRVRKRFPNDARSIDRALQATGKQDQAAAQRSRAFGRDVPHATRVIALEAAIELGGGETDWDSLNKAMRSPVGALAAAGARVLLDRELTGAPDAVASAIGACGDPKWVLENVADESELEQIVDATSILSGVGRAARRALAERVKEREALAAKHAEILARVEELRAELAEGDA